MIKAGDLDRRITLQTATQTKDSAGHPVTAWTDLDTVWAQVRDIANQSEEGISDGLALAKRQCWVTVRYRDDIGANMRILHDDRTLHIISEPAELGRKEGLKFKAEERTSEGQDL